MTGDPAKVDERLTGVSVPHERSLPERSDAAPPWLALRRDDLAALLAKYRQENRRPRQWIGLASMVGAFFAAWLLVIVAERVGAPPAVGWGIFAGGWAVALGSFALLWRRERELRARLQLECPACGAPLLDESVARGGISRADLAIATGNCPSCGAEILAP